MPEFIYDAFIDAIKLFPFLFLSFIVMELIEHKLNSKEKLTKLNKYGPLTGASLGMIPQCGFSTLASNLYSSKVITLGTLFSIYLSTSDEMIPILLSNKSSFKTIFELLITKFIIGLLFGIIVDLIYKQKRNNEINHLCEEEHCHCEDGIIKSSITHTIKIISFIFIINIILNLIIDESTITYFVAKNKILTPIITTLIGLIPNCGASVTITKLYISNIINFGSCISGLLASSGVGILVLFKQNKNIRENLLIILVLTIFSSICGIVLSII